MSIPKMAKAMGYIDDDLVSGAVEYKRTKKKNAWVKWGAMAACLCLVVVGACTLLLKPATQDDTQLNLLTYMNQLNLSAKEIPNPLFFSTTEIPKITEDDLLNSIKNNTVVEGTIDTIDSVRIQETDAVWFITTITIKVDEVIVGTADSEVRIVCASKYSGDIDENTVPIAKISGCYEGMRSVFVLRHLDKGSWNISGKEVYPSSLGEYYVVYRLDRSGDKLTFTEQNITVNIQDIN